MSHASNAAHTSSPRGDLSKYHCSIVQSTKHWESPSGTVTDFGIITFRIRFDGYSAGELSNGQSRVFIPAACLNWQQFADTVITTTY